MSTPTPLDPVALLLQQQNALLTEVSQLRAEVQRALTGQEVTADWRRAVDDDRTDFEARLRILERAAWKLAGLATGGGTGGGLLAWLLLHLLH